MHDYDLDQPLIDLISAVERTSWTARHAVEGVQIFGGIGSGKTSGSGRLFAHKYLINGFGGLVLTVKPDEKLIWQEYCQQTGREDDLLILEPGGQHSFNFLNYVSAVEDGEGSLTDNIVQVLKTVIRSGQEQNSGRSDDAFWESALDMLIFNILDLCKLAYGQVTVSQMFDIVQTIPKPDEHLQLNPATYVGKAFDQAFEKARHVVAEQVAHWSASRPEKERQLFKDDAIFHTELLEVLPEARLIKALDHFFFDNFIYMSDKTRSIIEFSFTAFLFRLSREPIYSLFCHRPSSFTPEDSLNGKIILINLPVKLYHKVGRDVQVLFKYIWQRAMEKRNIVENGRPVFLWADEAQTFLHEHDAEFQATARSSRVATVYISQNLPNYYASMGGHKSEYRVKSFLGTLATKVFHANADIETNRYASELIGEIYFEEETQSTTVAENFSQTKARSLKLERIARPEEFMRLKTGGPLNNYLVEGYLHRQGDRVMKGFNHVKMIFSQRYQRQS
ncbi:TraM recognition domain-containing protein [Spirosoma sp. HMF4905]|uniref:TraM recognition domain-containing protein n=1 Tax=Spirosoma arboris TaxID=2682092 RepID=A0A7K1SKX3_9BACT|nr:TraM recognition domain-containing protein [Spirosoma arboris]MVM34459.1 TraM recognition domain-containing protein [Spirosoma arboris]